MNEEMKNKAIELTDEEMDRVAGGKVAVIKNDILGMHVETCEIEEMGGQEFINALKNGPCSNFLRAPYAVGPASCQSCDHHEKNTYSQYAESDVIEYLMKKKFIICR